jgi:hypothetical protein
MGEGLVALPVELRSTERARVPVPTRTFSPGGGSST